MVGTGHSACAKWRRAVEVVDEVWAWELDVGGVEAVGEVGAAGGWALAATQLGEGEGEGRGRGREKEWTQI